MRRHTIRALPLLAALAVAGCGTDASTPQGQCEAQSYDDPTVKDIQMRGLGNPLTQQELLPDLKTAQNAAVQRCLRARGLAAPGGVEKEKREH
jgi:hypothetical protein